ncbi:MAG: hypothetical protein P4M09_32510 [Devosia sp.]|nr:hypothetical protein [Devosia sp.]
MTEFAVTRPRLAFRVGITGHRTLGNERTRDEIRKALGDQIGQLLAHVREKVAALAKLKEVADVYDPAFLTPDLRFVSPLADGADRLAAEVALANGYRLEVVTPFPRRQYVEDFTRDGVSEFEALLGAAAAPALELDGERWSEAADPLPEMMEEAERQRIEADRKIMKEDRDRAYEAVGRTVVRNCDLLIAIWDGLPSSGRGGTAEIVRYCAEFGGPVWLLSPDGKADPRWIFDLADYQRAAARRPSTEPPLFAQHAGAPFGRLNHYIDAIIRPPKITHKAPGMSRFVLHFVHKLRCICHGWHTWQHPDEKATRPWHIHHHARRVWFAVCHRELPQPVQVFVAEKKLPERGIWYLFDGLMRLFGRKTPATHQTEPTPPKGADWPFWQAAFDAADELAISYASRAANR